MRLYYRTGRFSASERFRTETHAANDRPRYVRLRRAMVRRPPFAGRPRKTDHDRRKSLGKTAKAIGCRRQAGCAVRRRSPRAGNALRRTSPPATPAGGEIEGKAAKGKAKRCSRLRSRRSRLRPRRREPKAPGLPGSWTEDGIRPVMALRASRRHGNVGRPAARSHPPRRRTICQADRFQATL